MINNWQYNNTYSTQMKTEFNRFLNDAKELDTK